MNEIKKFHEDERRDLEEKYTKDVSYRDGVIADLENTTNQQRNRNLD
jgi:hypothetical protein